MAGEAEADGEGGGRKSGGGGLDEEETEEGTMTEKGVLTESRYAKLVADVRKLIEESRSRAKTAVQRELVQTYWLVGKRISDEGLMEKSSYGDSVMEDLSDELGIDEDTLRRSVAFFKAYKVAPRGDFLVWSHYRELLNIKENQVRDFYETEAEKNAWTRDQLVKAIAQRKHESLMSVAAKKASKMLKRPTEATYVYRAEVERVIDGDTLLLRLCWQILRMLKLWSEYLGLPTHRFSPLTT